MTIITARGLALAAAATATGMALIGGSIAHASGNGADRHLSSTATATTQVTFKVVDCDGCTITVGNLKEGEHDGWTSKAKKVKDGTVTFAVPTSLTRGLSVQVRAPWEKGTHAVTNAVFRYQGLQPGDKIGFDRAKVKAKASACWAGTDEDAVTLRLKARESADSDGNLGTIAWLRTTQEWVGPMVAAEHGVVATQD